jgi:hypothetical protein
MIEEIQRLMSDDLSGKDADVLVDDVTRILGESRDLVFRNARTDPRLQQVSDKADESLKAAIDLAYELGLEVRCRIVRDTITPSVAYERWMVSPPASERKPGFFPMWVVERPASEEFVRSVKTTEDGWVVE